VTLHLPVRPTCDERELHKEFGCVFESTEAVDGPTDGCVLTVVAARGENLLLSASSAGGVFAYRVSSSAGGDDAMADDKPLSAFEMPQWEKVFAGSAATCLEVSESRSSVVTASEGGSLAWLKLDDAASVEKIGRAQVNGEDAVLLGNLRVLVDDAENKDTSRLAINAVKFLGRDSIVATVGYDVYELVASTGFRGLTVLLQFVC